MCCLFGLLDYGQSFSGREKSHILSVLGTECEARGIDATGISYNHRNRLAVYKRPVPAHRLNLRIPDGVCAVMGHTRMVTQGSPRKKRNNHPFYGCVGKQPFALAHNGVIHNDVLLRRQQQLPSTRIETDSYIAVQLLEQKKALSLDSLKYMAEQVEGSFCFTVLDSRDNLYLVKGDNPLCVYHFPKSGFYIYASTEEILQRALSKLRSSFGKAEKVILCCGEILRIDRWGNQSMGAFDASHLDQRWYYGRPYAFALQPANSGVGRGDGGYLSELKSVAGYFGYSPEEIELLVAEGFTYEELEELLYCGEI